MAEALAIPLGDQVRLRFLGWPETVQAWSNTERKIIEVPHPKTGKPLILHWNSRPYVVHAGQDIHIPFELAKKEYGDPRSLDKPQKFKPSWGGEEVIPDRVFEVNRLRGYHQNSITEFREHIPGERWEGPLSDLLPRVEVYSMTGEQIMMVTDDPNGDTVIIESQTRSAASNMQQTIQSQADAIMELKRTNDLLLQKLGVRREDLETLGVPEKVPHQSGSPEGLTEVPTSEPRVVYNPRTQKVSASEAMARRVLDSDPTRIEDLPVDID